MSRFDQPFIGLGLQGVWGFLLMWGLGDVIEVLVLFFLIFLCKIYKVAFLFNLVVVLENYIVVLVYVVVFEMMF